MHSSLVGFGGVTKEGLEVVFGKSHMLAAPLFLDATLLVAGELKLLQAIPQLIDWVKKAELVVGQVVIEEQIKYLKNLKNKPEVVP